MHSDEQFYSSMEKIKSVIEPRGFEVYSLKVGWYNDVVADAFKIHLDNDTPACVILSTPSMFEKTFKPFVKENLCQDHRMRDPIDVCVSEVIQHALEEAVPHLEVDVLHDYDMDAHHKPKVLVQTAAHVAGAAYYYQPRDIVKDTSSCSTKPINFSFNGTRNPPGCAYFLALVSAFKFGRKGKQPKLALWKFHCADKNALVFDNRDIFGDVHQHGLELKVGLCIHRRYGGWFAIRAVIVFKGLKCSGLEQVLPPDVVPLQADRVRMLEAYNHDWKNWTYRDIIPVETRYSEQQKLYFATLPRDRIQLLQQLVEDGW